MMAIHVRDDLLPSRPYPESCDFTQFYFKLSPTRRWGALSPTRPERLEDKPLYLASFRLLVIDVLGNLK
jgi:hypothetical protein